MREVLKSGRGYDTHNDTRDPTRSGTGSNLNNYYIYAELMI